MSIRRYGLIADTHNTIHPRILAAFEGAEAILHAGDVGEERLLDELAVVAPTYAVQGNCDLGDSRLPRLRVVELAFGRAIVTHSHLQDAVGRDPESLARHFRPQKPRLIVFGHTHVPYHARHNGAWVVNPGAACKPGPNNGSSAVVMTWDDESDAFDFETIPLSWPWL
jgi:putative phosphoesterase